MEHLPRRDGAPRNGRWSGCHSGWIEGTDPRGEGTSICRAPSGATPERGRAPPLSAAIEPHLCGSDHTCPGGRPRRYPRPAPHAVVRQSLGPADAGVPGWHRACCSRSARDVSKSAASTPTLRLYFAPPRTRPQDSAADSDPAARAACASLSPVQKAPVSTPSGPRIGRPCLRDQRVPGERTGRNS